MTPEAVSDRDHGFESARARRRRLPDGQEMGLSCPKTDGRVISSAIATKPSLARSRTACCSSRRRCRSSKVWSSPPTPSARRKPTSISAVNSSRATRIFRRALDAATQRGYVGERILGTDYSLNVVIHRGAGAYICGEETAQLESIEGKRGEPRLKPPFPAIAGLYGMPTVINNVETLGYVTHIIDARRAVVRGDRTREIARPQDHVGQRPRPPARQLRSAARHPRARADRGIRGRLAAQAHAQSLPTRRRVLRGAVRGRSRRGHRLRFARGQAHDARFGRLRGHGRHRVHGALREDAHALLRARIVRPVHAVPRRRPVGRAHGVATGSGRRVR